MSSSVPLNVLLCCPDYQNEPGGIQQFSRLLASSLRSSPWVGSLEVLDFPANADTGTKLRYMASCSQAAWTRPDLCLYTHVGLARIAPLFRLLGVPYWVCAHGIECWNLRRQDESNALLGADRILAVSHHTLNRMADMLPGLKSSLLVFPNHVESIPDKLTPQREARQHLRLPLDRRILLTVSRLRNDRYKGHREILAAMTALGPLYDDVDYAIAGGGDDLIALQQEVVERKLSERVHFLGPLSDDDRSVAYDACDAFVMPSTGEGFGIVFLEAMAHGKPVLAGSVDGSMDALEGHDCGVLVNPRNPCSVATGLAELLRQLATKPKAWQPDELRAHVRNHFGTGSLQAHVDSLLKEFSGRKNKCAA